MHAKQRETKSRDLYTFLAFHGGREWLRDDSEDSEDEIDIDVGSGYGGCCEDYDSTLITRLKGVEKLMWKMNVKSQKRT